MALQCTWFSEIDHTPDRHPTDTPYLVFQFMFGLAYPHSRGKTVCPISNGKYLINFVKINMSAPKTWQIPWHIHKEERLLFSQKKGRKVSGGWVENMCIGIFILEKFLKYVCKIPPECMSFLLHVSFLLPKYEAMLYCKECFLGN